MTGVEEVIYEEKIEQITECFEELILNAMIRVLKNIKERDESLASMQTRLKNDDIQF